MPLIKPLLTSPSVVVPINFFYYLSPSKFALQQIDFLIAKLILLLILIIAFPI